MLCSVRLRRTLLVCIAVSFAAIDLAHKSFTRAEFHHARTPLIALIMAVVIAALVVLGAAIQWMLCPRISNTEPAKPKTAPRPPRDVKDLGPVNLGPLRLKEARA